MRSYKRDGVDTINNLPNNVLDGILGCLPLKDAVGTSVLSKDWRYKWVYRQNLKFDDDFFRSFKQEAVTIIYQVLLLHKGPILKFKLRGSTTLKSSDIDHCILFLSKKNVQELTLDIHSANKYNLPSHLFKFQQLKHLKVYCGCLFQPPPEFRGFEKLTNLDLHFVTFVPAMLMNLISRCPLLERLRLVSCTNIDSIEIDASNLKYFEFDGISKSICFKNAPMLGKVVVHLVSNVSTDATPLCSNISNFFQYTPSLQELVLGHYTLEYLTIGGVPESPVSALNNVKSLNISDMSFRSVDEVSGVVYLITSCAKLQELTIDFFVNHVAEPVLQFLRGQLVKHGVMKFLRRVHMDGISGFKAEMELVRFILSSAPVLEKIIIFNYEHLFLRPGEQIMDEMKQFPRASANVEFKLDEVIVGDFLVSGSEVEDDYMFGGPEIVLMDLP